MIKKDIESDGSIIIFKKGEKVDILSYETVNGMNWINCDKTKQDIEIENYNDENSSDGKIVYHTTKKDVIKSTNFENGIPIFTASIKIVVDRVEIYGDREKLNKSIQLNDINEESKRLVEAKIKKEFSDALSVLRENKADLIGIYYQFYQKSRKDFKNFLKNLDDSEDFLNFVVFLLNITVEAD